MLLDTCYEYWKESREKILNLRTAWQIRYELLEKEGLYQRLLQAAETIALEWRRDYKWRRAMMEELGKAGF